MNISTPHINAKKEDVAKIVLMPGDPLRAKFIAENYLINVKKINGVRNMLMFTGEYQNKKVTVAGSGMGMPSIGIYAYELFHFYDVDAIIRIGSAGSYHHDLKIYEVVLANSSYSNSTFAQDMIGSKESVTYPSDLLNQKIIKVAKDLNIPLKMGRINSEDVFYNRLSLNERVKRSQALCVEMEAFALFATAKRCQKKAACLLTISDNLVSQEVTDWKERQKSFTKMMEIALNVAKGFS